MAEGQLRVNKGNDCHNEPKTKYIVNRASIVTASPDGCVICTRTESPDAVQ